MKLKFLMALPSVTLAILSGCSSSSTPSTSASTTPSASDDATGEAVEYPNLLALGQEVVPLVDTESAVVVRNRGVRGAVSSGLVTYDGTADDLTSYAPVIAEVFGNDMDGVNTQIIKQLSMASGYLNDAVTNHVDADGEFVDCDVTVTEDDTSFGIPFFKDTDTAIFWENADDGYDTGYDSGKFTCFVHEEDSDSDNDQATILGREEIDDADADCEDPYLYYISSGYSTPAGGVAEGHQIQKFIYNGCTHDIALAMHIGSQVDVTLDPEASGGSGQGFDGRFELIGNTDTHEFRLRVGKMDVYDTGGTSANLFTVAGKAKPGDDEDSAHFILRYKTICNGDLPCSGNGNTDVTFCLSIDADNVLTMEADTTACADHEEAFESLDNFAYEDIVGSDADGAAKALNATAIPMVAESFGLEAAE